jgi:hypothetical protein
MDRPLPSFRERRCVMFQEDINKVKEIARAIAKEEIALAFKVNAPPVKVKAAEAKPAAKLKEVKTATKNKKKYN